MRAEVENSVRTKEPGTTPCRLASAVLKLAGRRVGKICHVHSRAWRRSLDDPSRTSMSRSHASECIMVRSPTAAQSFHHFLDKSGLLIIIPLDATDLLAAHPRVPWASHPAGEVSIGVLELSLS